MSERALSNACTPICFQSATLRLLAILSIVCSSTGCAGAPSTADEDSPIEPGKPPATVQLPGAQVTVGFAAGRMRERVELPAFALTKHPITHKQYAACVKAGACDAVKKPACAETSLAQFRAFQLDDPRSPAVCVGPKNAAAYCGWVGGRLPRLSEWMYAARGPTPARFPWGEQPPTCEQHPLALAPVDPADPASSSFSRRPCHAGSDRPVLQIGSSPGPQKEGAQDFLLLTAELVAADEASLWNACSPALGASCLVYGREAGAIEAVTGIAESSDKTEPPSHLYAFRCVVED